MCVFFFLMAGTRNNDRHGHMVTYDFRRTRLVPTVRPDRHGDQHKTSEITNSTFSELADYMGYTARTLGVIYCVLQLA